MSCKEFRQSILLCFALSSLSFFKAQAQDNAVDTKPHLRPSASLGTPFGVTGSYSYNKVLGFDPDDHFDSTEVDIPSLFGITVSYDTWFAGVQREIYGDVVRIGNRPAETGLLNSIYLDVGSFSQQTVFTANSYYYNEQKDIINDEKISVVAVGISSSFGENSQDRTSVKFTNAYLLGRASAPDDSNYFGTVKYGALVSIPFAGSQWNIGADLFSGVLLANKRYTSDYTSSDYGEIIPVLSNNEDIIQPYYAYGIALTTSLTLGFQH